MKYFLITLGLIVYYLLNWFSTSLKAEVVTTNNLLNHTFTTNNNWKGQLSSNHGTNVIAGINGDSVENITPISLRNNANLTEAQIQNGWTSNQSAEVWFWNNNTQDVTMKQIITSSSGSTITQTKVVTGSCATYNGCTWQQTGNNTFISTLNTNTDYSINNKFEFNSTGNYNTGHNAADLRVPSLTITYENTPISVNDQKDIIKNARTIVEEIKETKVPTIKETVVEIKREIKEVKVIGIKEEPKPQPVVTVVEQKIEEKPEPKAEIKSESKEIKQETKVEEKKAVVKEEAKVEAKEESKKEAKVVEEQKVEEKEEPKSEPKPEQKTIIADKKKPSLKVGLNKIDGKAISIDKNMKLKSIIILKAMTDNAMISAYSIPFYKNKNLYQNQLSIADTKLLYTGNSLGVYISKDPVVQYQNVLINIRLEKQRLLNEIQVLKNG